MDPNNGTVRTIQTTLTKLTVVLGKKQDIREEQLSFTKQSLTLPYASIQHGKAW